MKKVHIAVCDDLEEDRGQLVGFLQEYLDTNRVAADIRVFQSGEEFLASDVTDIDLAFLDIYMDELNGMETAKALLKRNYRVQIVFTTTSLEFAAEAFQIDALQYLVKPVKREKLFRILDRFFDSIRVARSISVKVGRETESIYLSDIIYIEARGKKTVFHLKDGTVEVSESLSALKERLKDEQFCMPIRWALVPLAEVTGVFDGTLRLSDGTEIQASRSQKEKIREEYAAYKWDRMRRSMRTGNSSS